ncbi:MAG: hypothetical protein CVU57_24435 [Deltaproteobacteria bacterium HGW-Deltaproteobacteria-15]|jgi:ferredoxin|nr:MAG: hypothetical protein CVU57_24435 [Deltaproteobacteria bacterium HGW-Deltaproteobacteria-15]
MRSKSKTTPYVSVDTHKCEACWKCVDTCRTGTLGKVNFWFHKHVVVINAESCRGCGPCVEVCPEGAFVRIERSQMRCQALS